jgi:hypothetical protein
LKAKSWRLLDGDLYDALNARYKKFWSTFSPQGTVSVWYSLAKLSRTGKEKSLKVELEGIEAAYEHFSYPLKNLRGTLLFDRDTVTVSQVLSEFDGQKIRFGGSIRLAGEAEEPLYRLSVRAEQLELEEDWIALLPSSARETVRQLQPKGKIDVTIELNRAAGQRRPDYEVIVDCLGNSAAFSLGQQSRSLVPINLEWLSCSLEDVRGIIRVSPDSVELRQVTARAVSKSDEPMHIPPLEINGQITLADGNFSNGTFSIVADDIVLDDHFGSAMPESVRGFYSALSPAGRCDLHFGSIRVFDEAAGNRCAEIEGRIQLKGCDLNIRPLVTGLDGELGVSLLYNSSTGAFQGQTRLAAEKVTIKGQPLTAFEANIVYDESRRSWLIKDIASDCQGGRLTGKLEFSEAGDKEAGYELQLGFEDVDLQAFVKDWMRTMEGEPGAGEQANWTSSVDLDSLGSWENKRTEHSSGRICGSLSVSGRIGRTGDDDRERIGKCTVTVTDVKVGKLSPLAKMLYVLSFTEPKDFAFDRIFVDSYISHNKVFFDCLDLSGEAAAFSGSGWMDLRDHSVSLVLFARGPRLVSDEPSVLQSLTESLGSAVVRIEVTGNFYDPTVRQKTLDLFSSKSALPGP